MKVTILFTLLCAVYVYAGPVNLTPENFDSVVDGSKNVFIKFFAPWCGHCKAMVGAYDEVAEAFAKESEVVIADVDADAHKDLAGRFGVTGFPTLKFFKKGSTEPEDYNGGREAADIVEYVNKQAGSRARIAKAASAVTVLSPENFDSFVLDPTKEAFVEFYAPWCGHCKRLTPIWEKLAGVFKGDSNVVIANVDADAHKDLGSKYGVTGFPTLIYFSKTDKSG
jgi:protein disulfide-isomerase A6